MIKQHKLKKFIVFMQYYGSDINNILDSFETFEEAKTYEESVPNSIDYNVMIGELKND